MSGPGDSLPYQALLESISANSEEERLISLWPELTGRWFDLYEQNTSGPSACDLIERGRLIYAHDTHMYPEDIDFDFRTMVDDRVIFVAGYSVHVQNARDPYGMRAPLGQREFGDTPDDLPFDRGHFIAHSLGGFEDMGLFPQRRDINRGRSEAGRRFVAMERYARRHPGTFVFARPIYGDNTAHPFWLEFGVLKQDGQFWVETFPNRYTFKPFYDRSEAPQWFLDLVERDGLRAKRARARKSP